MYINKYNLNFSKLTSLLDDPILLLMIFAIGCSIRDPFGVFFYIGLLALSRIIYSNSVCVQSNYEIKKKAVLVLMIAISWMFLCRPINRIHLPVDRLFQIHINNSNYELFPGWLFFISYYVFPVFIRRFLDGSFLHLFREYKLTYKDCLIIIATWIPIILMSFTTSYKSGDILSGLKGFYIPGIYEELYFRGLILYTFLHICSCWKAILLSTLCFTLHHTSLISEIFQNPSVFLVGNLAAIVALSILLSWIYSRTRRIAVCTLIHGGVDGLIFICHSIGFKTFNFDLLNELYKI